MKEYNNVRNRWRRYRDTRKAYGFTFLSIRHWISVGWAKSGSYMIELTPEGDAKHASERAS